MTSGGADFTAHHSGRTYGQAEGYVIAKANALADVAPLPSQLGIPPAVALELYHNFVESGVDILMKRIDPMIGQKMASAAMLRAPNFPRLLVRAYAGDLAPNVGGYEQAAHLIITKEAEYRKLMMVYGQVLMQEEETAVSLIAEQLADFAAAFLAAYGLSAPPREQAVQLAYQYIKAAMQICEVDYAREVSATIISVGQQLSANGISYPGK